MRYVYLIRNEESGNYKLGVSKHPEKRLKALQTGNDEELTLIERFPSKFPTKVETALHNKYAPNRKRGEWFNLYLENELTFISECVKIEKNIEYLFKNGNIFI